MEYPEHKKLHDLRERNDVVGEFLEWMLYETDYIIAENVHDDWCESLKDDDALCNCQMPLAPTSSSILEIVSKYSDIDTKKLEKNKK